MHCQHDSESRKKKQINHCIKDDTGEMFSLFLQHALLIKLEFPLLCFFFSERIMSEQMVATAATY